MTSAPPLGLRANWPQFSLLVLVNALVGAMVGLERSLLPVLAEYEFGLVAQTAILSFIIVFGVAKAITNWSAGKWSDRYGRRRVLISGWLVAVPVPFLLMWAPSWGWVLIANLFLGISQGLTWSTTIIMKIDLVGPRRRGLAMGLNEFAGYLAVAVSAWATSWLASHYGLRPVPFYLGVAYVACGLVLSGMWVRESRGHVAAEVRDRASADVALSARQVFWLTTWKDRDLSTITQAGLFNNFNDGVAWGLFPALFASRGLSIAQIGTLVAIYPAAWGIAQLGTGALSDRGGRKWLIAGGLVLQAFALAGIASVDSFAGIAAASVVLGLGTALVYPTLLAAIGDVAHPQWRASAVGAYRFWRDLGYAAGALIAGVSAQLLGVPAAIGLTAAVTFLSGVIVALRLRETSAPCLSRKSSNSDKNG